MATSTVSAHFRGILLSVGIALTAVLLHTWFSLNSILISLILGIVVGNALKLPDTFNPGIKFSSGRFLEIAIILMAFGIDYGSFLRLGWETILIVVITIVAVLYMTLWLSKRLSCPSSAGLLVGFGTAICGSSAIAALAPSVSKDKSDMGIAMAVVNLYGLIGMVLLPMATSMWLSDLQNGILLGTSLHSVGNVAGAGFSMSEAVGEMAVTVKLGRVALLTPALLLFTYFTRDTNDQETAKNLNLPYYLVAFILISIIVSIVPLSEQLLALTKQGSNFLLAVAMGAIGLKVSFKTLLSSGKKGLIFGAILFAVQLVVIAALMYLLL